MSPPPIEQESEPLEPTSNSRVLKYVFYNRTIVEIMIIVFTFIVGFTVLGFGIFVVVAAVFAPSLDTIELTDWVTNIITTMAAALLGLVVGQTAEQADRKGKGNKKE